MLLFVSLIFLSSIFGDALILDGALSTKSDWHFIARFCYQTDNGVLDYVFEYPESYCCQDAILYYDSQWESVYPAPSLTCPSKVRVASRQRNQILDLENRTDGCQSIIRDGIRKISCKSYRTLSSARPRWWYLVISNCGAKQGLQLNYRMVMTNGRTFWTKHFSADEKNILETDIVFLIFFLSLFILSGIVAYTLLTRQLFHTTYKLYMWAIFLELMSIVINIVYYTEYGLSGQPSKGVKNIGRACHCISDTLLVVLLILLGKGWTITRARISPAGQIKLSVFCTLYGIAYVSLFIYEAKAFDPGEVLYIYESPAGVGLCIMKVIAWLWFCYGIFFTLKNYAEKRFFYFPFFAFYTIWFLSGPIIVLIAASSVEPYAREQIMNGVDRSVAFSAFAFFLILTRPSAANKNFPYHVRTTQIGFIDDTANPNFARSTYKPENEEAELARRMNTLFSAHNNEGTRPLTGSMASPPSSMNSRHSSINTNNTLNMGESLGRRNPSYNDNDDRPNASTNRPTLLDLKDRLTTPSPHPNASLPPPMNYSTNQNKKLKKETKNENETRTESPFVQNSNFVTTGGEIYQQEEQLPKNPPPLIRTEQQMTSLFAARPSPSQNLSPMTPNPPSTSPNFFIPEPTLTPDFEQIPPLPQTGKPIDSSNNNTIKEDMENPTDSQNNGGTSPSQETNNENNSSNKSQNEQNNELVQSPRKKKGKKKSTKKKRKSEANSPSDPNHLPPLSAAPSTLPPLRGGKLPPLGKNSDSTV